MASRCEMEIERDDRKASEKHARSGSDHSASLEFVQIQNVMIRWTLMHVNSKSLQQQPLSSQIPLED